MVLDDKLLIIRSAVRSMSMTGVLVLLSVHLQTGQGRSGILLERFLNDFEVPIFDKKQRILVTKVKLL